MGRREPWPFLRRLDGAWQGCPSPWRGGSGAGDCGHAPRGDRWLEGEQREPHRDGGVPCAPPGRQGQQGPPPATTGQCFAHPSAGETSSGNIPVVTGDLPGPGLRCGATALGAWVTSRRGITSRATCTTGKGFGGLRRSTVQRLIDQEARHNNATQRTTHQQGVGLAMQPIAMQQQTSWR